MNTALKWIGGTALGAGLAFALLVPKPGKPATKSERGVAWMEYQQAAYASRSLNELRMRAEARAIANALPEVPSATPFTRFAPELPADVATRLGEKLSAELSDAGAMPPRYPIALTVSVDTALLSAAYIRAIVLPERAGAPCTVSLTVADRHKKSLAVSGTQRLLGTCAFYAAFGAPGAANAAWLRDTHMVSARYLRTPFAFTGDTAKVDLNSLRSYYSVGPIDIYGCRSGDAIACASLLTPDPARLLADDSDIARDPRVDSFEPGTEVDWSTFSDGGPFNMQAGMLAAMARDLGHERFGELWRDDRPLAESYPVQTGRPLTAWVSDFVAERTLPYSAGPGIGVLQTVLGIGLTLLAIGVALRFSPRRMT